MTSLFFLASLASTRPNHPFSCQQSVLGFTYHKITGQDQGLVQLVEGNLQDVLLPVVGDADARDVSVQLGRVGAQLPEDMEVVRVLLKLNWQRVHEEGSRHFLAVDTVV